MPEDITIGITFKLEQIDRAEAGLKSIASAFKEIDEAYRGMPSEVQAVFKQMAEGVTEAETVLQKMVESSKRDMEEQAGSLKKKGEAFKEAEGKVTSFLTEYSKLATQGAVTRESMQEVSDRLKMTSSQLRAGQAYILAFGKASEEGKVSLDKFQTMIAETSKDLAILRESEKLAKQATAGMVVATDKETDSMKALQAFTGMAGAERKAYGELARDARNAELQYNLAMQQAEPIMMGMRHAVRLTDESIAKLTQVTGMSADELRKYSRTMDDTARSTRALSIYNRMMTRQLTPTARVVNRFGREIFWTGLGFMFATMSLARHHRRSQMLEVQTYSLARAELRLKDTIKDVREATLLYGASSEQARQARIRQKEAEFALEMQTRSLRAAIEQQVYSYAMLVFGIFPTMMRTGTAIWELYKGLTGARYAENIAMKQSMAYSTGLSVTKDKESSSSIGAAIASIFHAGATETAGSSAATGSGLNIMYDTTVRLKAAGDIAAGGASLFHAAAMRILLGVGITVVAMLATMAVVQSQVDRMMKEQMRTVEEYKREFSGSGLVQAIQETNNAMREISFDEMNRGMILSSRRARTLTEDISRLEQALEVPEARISIETEIEEVPRIEIPEYKQIVRQELIRTEIPELEEISQIIKQTLIEVSVEEPKILEQVISQRLEEANIPIPSNLTQRIIQQLIEAPIPKIEDQVQIIEQELIRTTIPPVELEEVTQLIRQDLEEAEIIRPEDITQRIVQRLIEADITIPPDLTQRITQVLEKADIPEITDQIQYIKQSLIEVSIPEIEGQEQLIIQEVLSADIPEVNNITQFITQEFIETRIPQIEDIEQNIIQVLQEVDIREPREFTQIINQRLIQADIPVPEDIIQSIVQELHPMIIPPVEDRTLITREEFIPARVPEITEEERKLREELHAQIEIVKVPLEREVLPELKLGPYERVLLKRISDYTLGTEKGMTRGVEALSRIDYALTSPGSVYVKMKEPIDYPTAEEKTQINIHIHNPIIREEQDIDRLIRKIRNEMNKEISRRG